MKFRNYLDTISDIGIYPLVSLLIFFVFFVGLIIYVLRLDKKTTKTIANLPLEDGSLRTLTLTILLGLITFSGSAQGTQTDIHGNDELLNHLLFVGLGILIVLVGIIFIQVLSLHRKLAQKAYPEHQAKAIFSEKWWQKFGGFGTSLSEEDRILIKEHDYDGIQELDNRMPPWLAFLFQITILFAIGYMIIYQVTNLGDSPETELSKSLHQAEIQKTAYLEKVGSTIDENSVVALSDEKSLSAGKSLFVEKCSACHGGAGEGGVGPNLTDANWLHGGGIKNIFKIIKYGVPEKGMISWEKQLKANEIQQIASYILTIKNTNPPNAKEPQGDLWNDEATPAAVSMVP